MNPNGNTATLTPVGEGNALAVRHAAYSPRLREPRAREIADTLMEAPHMTELDRLGALEIGRIVAFVEALEAALQDGPINSKGQAKAAADLRLRASRRLQELLDAYGLSPRARFSFGARLAAAEDLRRRLGEA